MKRRSAITGEMIETPDPVPSGPDLSAQVADLRVQLATEQGRRESAESRCADLEARLLEANERTSRIESDLERARNRVDALSSVPAPLPVQPQEQHKPIAYEAIVVKRDDEGKMHRVQIVPVSE